MNRVVNQILSSMDGVESMEGVIVVAATNRPEMTIRHSSGVVDSRESRTFLPGQAVEVGDPQNTLFRDAIRPLQA